MNIRRHARPRRCQRGLSLIEILVGVAIGIIGILAIFQTVSVWNKHTQTTASGSDAQVAGTLALYNIERDLKLAGFGFAQADPTVMGCSVQADDAALGRSFQFRLRPIDIAASAGGAPDTITVAYGNSAFFVTNEIFNSSTASTKQVVRRYGFKPGDLAVVAGNAVPASAASATCQLVEVTNVDDPDGLTVGHTALPYVSFYAAASAAASAPRFNPVAGTGATFSSGTMYDLGPQPSVNTWAIANFRRLERTDAISGAPPFQMADGVINLKAQYGVDADASGRIEAGEWTDVAPADWTTVLAVRVAVLVRGQQYELNGDSAASATAAVTASAPTWAGGTFLMTNVDGQADSFGPANADPNNWRYYRYRVYERVIPLRNMLWGTLQ